MASIANIETGMRAGTSPGAAPRTLPVVAFGMGLSSFFAISYVICVLGYLLLPSLPVEHSALGVLLPGFTLLSWPSFFLGLVESIAWGWYTAILFAPLYNFFVRKFPA